MMGTSVASIRCEANRIKGALALPADRIVALALVTQPELELLGPSFRRAYPIDETPRFGELLQAIDEADRAVWRQRDAEAGRDAEPVAMQQPMPRTV
jgi:hypothetical protein